MVRTDMVTLLARAGTALTIAPTRVVERQGAEDFWVLRAVPSAKEVGLAL